MMIADRLEARETATPVEFRTDDYADGMMDPRWARVMVAFVFVSLLALWGLVDLVLRAVAWWGL